MTQELPEKFNLFQQKVDHISLPGQFTFPFYYEPHALCKIAADELQVSRLINHQYQHNFGLNTVEKGMVIGKMFGVLVVTTEQGTLGYLAAFSGKLADSNHHDGFVPTIYDMLTDDSHFKQEEIVINDLTLQIERMEQDPDYLKMLATLKTAREKAVQTIAQTKKRHKELKAKRKEQRQHMKLTLDAASYDDLLEELKNQSIKNSYLLKDEISYWERQIDAHKQALQLKSVEIQALRDLRKAKSNTLQQFLFEQYKFLNAQGVEKNLMDIFTDRLGITPPAGSGECAAPKLLQYAYIHHLRPIAMAEFWWGQSPKSQVRKHKQYYPACRSKCEPILGHMLQGLSVDPNPIQDVTQRAMDISLLYEDDHIIVINKPTELLSVPGKTISDSVWSRMRHKYPDATGPLIVHRLDMSTSGLMILALTKEAHKYLQHQFIKRTAEKRYVAILSDTLTEQSGYISLPLRVDLDNRPHQLVCYEHGKKATTYWELIKTINGKSWVHFYPKTGRTHQLRVHAAHQDGLNAPIIGDDLYGIRKDRLYLHAETLTIRHPQNRELITFNCPTNWDE